MSSLNLPLPAAAPEPAGPIALDGLEVGSAGTIVDVRDGGGIGQRLLDLGFVPGTRVTLVRRAPLRDPAVYELRGVRFCLRRSEARRVLVAPEDADRERG